MVDGGLEGGGRWDDGDGTYDPEMPASILRDPEREEKKDGEVTGNVSSQWDHPEQREKVMRLTSAQPPS